MSSKQNITLHMVQSLDGYVAKRDNDVSWMHSTDSYEKGKALTEQDIQDYLDGIDCYVMGSRTYEHALELGWVYGDKPVYVLTSRDLVSDKPTVHFFRGDSGDLVNNELKDFRSIWMVGGPATVKDFLLNDLADEIVITTMPVILGDGLPFFDVIGKEISLHLKEVTSYTDGMVEIRYQIK